MRIDFPQFFGKNSLYFIMVDDNDLKHDVAPSNRDFDLGEMLAIESTPEEERRVLRKLDFVQVRRSCFSEQPSNFRTD